MSIQNTIGFACLPIIAIDLAPFISSDQELAVVAEVKSTSVTSAIVTGEFLCPDSSEVSSFVLVNYDLVVRRLACEVLS